MFTEMELFECPDPITLDFFFVWLEEQRSLQKEGGCSRRTARSQCGCRSLHKEREDQLTGTTRDFRTRDAKCTEVDCEIFRTFIVNRLVCIVVSCLVCIVVICLVCIVVICLVCIVVICLVCIVVSCLVCTVVILCVFVLLCVYC